MNGCICTIEDMPRILMKLITNKDIQTTLKQGMKGDKYNNAMIVKDICCLFNEG